MVYLILVCFGCLVWYSCTLIFNFLLGLELVKMCGVVFLKATLVFIFGPNFRTSTQVQAE